ncbi:transmembrane protease serine 11D-like isoform X1 [Montipora capricornis]|uniref:transmembrane protease serine 11D-like isoform X1 n=1 Tax=Montipora capricornis TaxID=246305 RepID=UPI0035F111FF
MLRLKLLFFVSTIPLYDFASLQGEPFSVFPQDCGIRKIRTSTGRRSKRIVGGTQSSQGNWPWQAALFYKGSHYCGGAVISNTWILTSAHCFNPYTSNNPADWTSVLGDHRLSERDDRFEQRRKIVNITVHENYKSMFFEKIYDTPPMNDVAILKLDKPLVFTNHVQPLCLPRTDEVFAPNEECHVAGWGHTEWNGRQADVLREIKVRIVSREVCNLEKSYNGTIHDTALCAGFPKGGIDACEYDSGGPLVCVKCGRHYAAGLVSWGDECGAPYKYGVYSNLTVLEPWITDRINRFERENGNINGSRG